MLEEIIKGLAGVVSGHSPALLATAFTTGFIAIISHLLLVMLAGTVPPERDQGLYDWPLTRGCTLFGILTAAQTAGFLHHPTLPRTALSITTALTLSSLVILSANLLYRYRHHRRTTIPPIVRRQLHSNQPRSYPDE